MEFMDDEDECVLFEVSIVERMIKTMIFKKPVNGLLCRLLITKSILVNWALIGETTRVRGALVFGHYLI